ncbi:5-methylcytosine-specific restriction enzyme subunit McrC [Luteimonas sp. RC10]|nr:5-methylcytosine-specific restriction enzyme subunit McrC [Luteimonas sp. RC10]
MGELLEHVAVNKQRVIHIGSVSYTTGQLRPQNLIDLLALRLVTLTKQMRLNGLDHSYRPTVVAGRTPVGSILPFATRVRQAFKGNRAESVSSAWIKTIDTPANRMVLATLLYLHRLYMRLGHSKGAPTMRAELGDGIEVFRRIEAGRQELSMLALTPIEGKAAKRPEYLEASSIARAVFGQAGIQPQATGLLSLSPVVFNLEDAFEAFLRTRLRDSLTESGLRVLDGNIKHPEGLQDVLYSEPKHKKAEGIPVKPDIVICRGSEVLAVIDVKYKPYGGGLPDRADVEQVVTYAQIYETNLAIVALPQRPPNAHPLIPIGRIGQTNIAVLAVNLNTNDLASEIEIVAGSITRVLLKRPGPVQSDLVSPGLAVISQ